MKFQWDNLTHTAKYEYRKFIDRNALVASKLGPSRSATSVGAPSASSSSRSVSSPLAPASRSATLPSSTSTASSLGKSPLSSSPAPAAVAVKREAAQVRSASQPAVQPQQQPQQQQPQPQPQQQQSKPALPQGGVWNDLIQLQDAKPTSSTLPLQYQQPQQHQLVANGLSSPMFTGSSIGSNPTGLGVGSPFNPFHAQQQLQMQGQMSAGLNVSSAGGFPFAQQGQQLAQPMQPQSTFGQQLFMSHTGAPPASAPLTMNSMNPGTPGVSSASTQFFQPTPQANGVGLQTPQGYTLTPSPSIGVPMSAPPGQTSFITPSPGLQGQGFVSHSPQLMMQQQQQGGQIFSMTPSPQPGMGLGMNGSTIGGVGVQGSMVQGHGQTPGDQFLGMLSPGNFQANQQVGYGARNPFAQM